MTRPKLPSSASFHYIECTISGEWSVLPKRLLHELHARGLAHPGDDSWTLADGVDWDRLESHIWDLEKALA